jgi:hypothetical protein
MQGWHKSGIPEHSPPKSGGKHEPRTGPEMKLDVSILTEQPPLVLHLLIQLEFFCPAKGGSTTKVSINSGVKLEIDDDGSDESLLFKVGNPAKSSGKITGGRIVSGSSGIPEHNPGYSREQVVPGGHSEQGSPLMYISDRIKFPATP